MVRVKKLIYGTALGGAAILLVFALAEKNTPLAYADTAGIYELHFKPTRNKKNADFVNSTDWAYMDAYTETTYRYYLVSLGEPRTVKFHYKGISDFIAPVDPQIAGWKNLAAGGYWGNCEPIHGITKVIVEAETLKSPYVYNPTFTVSFGNIYSTAFGVLQGTAATWNFTACRSGPETGAAPYIPTLEYYPTGTVDYFSIVPTEEMAIIDIQIFYTCIDSGAKPLTSTQPGLDTGTPIEPTSGTIPTISIPSGW
jgi:hypothetical protein